MIRFHECNCFYLIDSIDRSIWIDHILLNLEVNIWIDNRNMLYNYKTCKYSENQTETNSFLSIIKTRYFV